MEAHTKPVLSVVICTRDPRRDYLQRVLQGLKAQTLPLDHWELLLIDNASVEQLGGELDLSWHPRSRIVRENKVGLTLARLRGIRETLSPLLVFVDDDNVLAGDYLVETMRIADRFPFLGAWSGNVSGEFETPAPKELEPFLWCLCLREVRKDLWGNYRDPGLLPWGAGMCVRRLVVNRFAEEWRNSPVRKLLGAEDSAPRGANDFDLVWSGFELGMGTGLFKALMVTHLIPSRRLEEQHFFRMVSSGILGYEVFKALRGIQDEFPTSRVDTLVAHYKSWRATSMHRKMEAARREGEARGRKLLAVLAERSLRQC